MSSIPGQDALSGRTMKKKPTEKPHRLCLFEVSHTNAEEVEVDQTFHVALYSGQTRINSIQMKSTAFELACGFEFLGQQTSKRSETDYL